MEPIQYDFEFLDDSRSISPERGMRGMLGGRRGQVNSALKSIEAIHAANCHAAAALVLQ